MGGDTSDNTCKQCSSVITGCDECHMDLGNWVCDTCNAATPLKTSVGDVCYSACPADFVDNTSNLCVACPANCDSASCTWSSANSRSECTQCITDFFVQPDGSCTANCAIDESLMGTSSTVVYVSLNAQLTWDQTTTIRISVFRDQPVATATYSTSSKELRSAILVTLTTSGQAQQNQTSKTTDV